MSQGWQGGSAAVTESSSLMRTDVVAAVSLLKRTSEDERHGQNRDGSDKKGKGFAGILEQEVSKTEEPRDIRVQTNGYTRMGMPSAIMIRMREYTY